MKILYMKRKIRIECLYDCHKLKQLLEKLHSEFLHALCDPVPEMKKNIVTFWHNFAHTINSSVVSLYITVMINVLQKF